MRNSPPRALVALLLTSAGCSGQLLFGAGDGDGAAHQPCTAVSTHGECPDSLQCCGGVCAASCEDWTCDCEPDQACDRGTCVDISIDTQCTKSNPAGLCPVGEVCVGGTCVRLSGPCGCPAGQACVDGDCVEIPDDEACSREHPDGLCPDGSVCVDAECVPSDNVCSARHPTGLCPPGATCVAGLCRPVEEQPCGPEAPHGCCPSCQSCESGSCEQVLCSADAPFCVCPAPGDICQAGTCECEPCSVGHQNGCCGSDAEYCSAAGYCLPEGVCGADADCTALNTICACDGACIPRGQCHCESDCGEYQTCVDGECQSATNCPNGDVDCPDGEICDTTGQCRTEGTCGAPADCREDGTFCSGCGECLADGYCCNPSDCAGGTFCSTDGTCIADGTCNSSTDCGPGEVCTDHACEAGGEACTANGGASCVPGVDDTYWCCPTGEVCCRQGERCGADGLCILDGQCIDDSDCLAGSFTCVDDACAPLAPCTSSLQCAPGQVCSAAGGCIPDDGTCADDGDCATGEVCNALFACEPATSCGDETFQATLVPPNMLVVLDRSGSMNYCLAAGCPTEQQDCDAAHGCIWQGNSCVDQCATVASRWTCNNTDGCIWDDGLGSCRPVATRWETAVGVLKEVLTTYSDSIRFGLSLYPLPCDNAFANICDTPPSNCVGAGGAEVPVDANTASQISDTLDAGFPGGGTPTQPTLLAVEADRNTFGLPSNSDDVERGNYILLVTDGDANNSVSDSRCTLGSSDADRVNCVLDRLQHPGNSDPPVKTFVVGFVGGSPENLNCHAFYGGTARQDTCSGVTGDTCAGVTGPCYYPANNRAELLTALSQIVGSVAACNYALDSVPPDPNRLYVYLDYQCSGISEQSACDDTPGCSYVEGACTGEPVRVERDLSHTTGWDYDAVNNQVTFAGDVCELLKAGTVVPVVIMGCGSGEG